MPRFGSLDDVGALDFRYSSYALGGEGVDVVAVWCRPADLRVPSVLIELGPHAEKSVVPETVVGQDLDLGALMGLWDDAARHEHEGATWHWLGPPFQRGPRIQISVAAEGQEGAQELDQTGHDKLIGAGSRRPHAEGLHASPGLCREEDPAAHAASWGIVRGGALCAFGLCHRRGDRAGPRRGERESEATPVLGGREALARPSGEA